MGRKKKSIEPAEVKTPRPKGRPRKKPLGPSEPSAGSDPVRVESKSAGKPKSRAIGSRSAKGQRRRSSCTASSSTEHIVIDLIDDPSSSENHTPSRSADDEDEHILIEAPAPQTRIPPSRRGSESSEEYEYSTSESIDPINIEDMIGGGVTDSAYLLYDSVLNSALRSEVVIDSSGANVDRSSLESPERATPMEVDESDPANDPSPLQVTKKKGDTFYSPKSRRQKQLESEADTKVGNQNEKESTQNPVADVVEINRSSSTESAKRTVATDNATEAVDHATDLGSPNSRNMQSCSVRVERMSNELSNAQRPSLSATQAKDAAKKVSKLIIADTVSPKKILEDDSLSSSKSMAKVPVDDKSQNNKTPMKPVPEKMGVNVSPTIDLHKSVVPQDRSHEEVLTCSSMDGNLPVTDSSSKKEGLSLHRESVDQPTVSAEPSESVTSALPGSNIVKEGRPKRQTRAPKRIADAFKPRVSTKATKASVRPGELTTQPKVKQTVTVSKPEPQQSSIPDKPLPPANDSLKDIPLSNVSLTSLPSDIPDNSKSQPQSQSPSVSSGAGKPTKVVKMNLPADTTKTHQLKNPTRPHEESDSDAPRSSTELKSDDTGAHQTSDPTTANPVSIPEKQQVSEVPLPPEMKQMAETAHSAESAKMQEAPFSNTQQVPDSTKPTPSIDDGQSKTLVDVGAKLVSPLKSAEPAESTKSPNTASLKVPISPTPVSSKPPAVSGASDSLKSKAISTSHQTESLPAPSAPSSQFPIPPAKSELKSGKVPVQQPPSKSQESPAAKTSQSVESGRKSKAQLTSRSQQSPRSQSPMQSPTRSTSPKPPPTESSTTPRPSQELPKVDQASPLNKTVSCNPAVASPKAAVASKPTPKMTIISLFPDDALLLPSNSPKHSQRSHQKSSNAVLSKSNSALSKAAVSPKQVMSPKPGNSVPRRASSPTCPLSPKPTSPVKPAMTTVSISSPRPSSPVESPKRAASPKPTVPSKAATPKVTLPSKSPAQSKSSTKAVKTKGALKYISPEKTSVPKTTPTKGAKGIVKATSKVVVSKENTPDKGYATPEPVNVVQRDLTPKPPEPPTDDVTHFNGADLPSKDDPSKQAKTPKTELKKEPPKKPEGAGGTRRRSNRIRVNRWDKGPPVPTPATAASASTVSFLTSDAVVSSTTLGPGAAISSGCTGQQMSLVGHLPEPLGPPSSVLPPSFETDKPVKVKSRWRRTSELEMGAGAATSLATPPSQVTTPEPNVQSPTGALPPVLSPTPHQQPPIQQAIVPAVSPSSEMFGQETVVAVAPVAEPALPKPPSYVTDHPEITERLNGFEVIRENVYLTQRHRSKEAKRMTCECTFSEEEIARGEPGCGEDCLNRLLMIECSNRCSLGDYCSNKRFQNCEYSKCTVVKTDKKGLGLISSVDIPSGEFLMEYVGEVLDPKEFRRRAKEYSKDKSLHFYFMALKSDAIIDATSKGNISRFINHSCDPNAETQKWTVNGELRIGFFSKRAIAAHEEVTFDYQLQRYGKEAQRCYCESSNCRGWIGEEPEKEDKEEKDRTWEKMKDKKEKKKTREELEEEIEKLRLSGIKNRAHTLMLNRLMVRAEDYSSRSQLLAITQSDVDQRCLRLFLDYHGLNLIWSWMVDSSAPTSLKIQILDTFSVLPITNKTILLDSKVYGVVERWSNLGNASASEAQREEGSSPDSEETSDSTGAVKAEPDGLAKVDDAVPSTAVNDPERATLIAKAIALMQTWSTLKEEFRIPKKERIEQMKEHEREADRGYVDHEKAVKSETSYDRHWSFEKDRSKKRGRDSPDSLEWKASKSGRRDERYSQLSKNERRQLFQMKVEEEERQKRLEEERWTNHQEQCYALGVDPTMSYPQNNGFFHPLDGTEMPPEIFGPGGMVPPQGFPPPPPPSPFPMEPAFPPAFPPHFHQMGMGPSPPLGPPGGMLPPPGMGPPPPPPQGMGPPPQGMGPPPPGMVPPLGMPFVPPGMPFPPGGMPPPGAMPPGPFPHMPTPPQPGYPAPPYLPGAPSIGMEPPPQEPLGPQEPPPPAPPSTVLVLKLPKNWKITSDGRRSYYYHTKTRHVQWKFPTVVEVAAEEAKCGAKSKAGHQEDSEDSEDDEEDSESEEEESSSDENEEKEEEEDDDDYDDHSLLTEARRKAQAENAAMATDRINPAGEQRLIEAAVAPLTELPADTNTPERLTDPTEPPPKKRREGLCTQYIISPRDEEEDYRKGIKKSKIRETKMKLAKAKAKAKAKAAAMGKSKSKKAKTCEADTSKTNSKIKDRFRVEMANVTVTLLNPYRKPDCKIGRITNTEDFKHLARKLTHAVMVKEMKHVSNIEDLQCNENVKHKARDFIKKYMAKFGAVYSRQPDD